MTQTTKQLMLLNVIIKTFIGEGDTSKESHGIIIKKNQNGCTYVLATSKKKILLLFNNIMITLFM